MPDFLRSETFTPANEWKDCLGLLIAFAVLMGIVASAGINGVEVWRTTVRAMASPRAFVPSGSNPSVSTVPASIANAKEK